jgi:N-acetyl-beta-hexosaminidase
MSRRIYSKTSITDKDLALQALKQAGIQYQDQGKTILFTSGEMANATLDLTTGTISGDSDFGHTKEGLVGLLRQHYSEAQIKREYAKLGTTIDERQTDGQDVVLMWHMA